MYNNTPCRIGSNHDEYAWAVCESKSIHIHTIIYAHSIYIRLWVYNWILSKIILEFRFLQNEHYNRSMIVAE